MSTHVLFIKFTNDKYLFVIFKLIKVIYDNSVFGIKDLHLFYIFLWLCDGILILGYLLNK